MKRLMRIAALIALGGMLTACGFHLQERSELPQAMAMTSLEVQSPYSPFARQLAILLEQNGVQVVERSHATAILEIPVNVVRKEILTIGDNARVREYRLHHAVRFRLVDVEGRVVVPERYLEQSRVISFDEQDILAATQEEEFLRKNMADTLSRLVLRHLGAPRS